MNRKLGMTLVVVGVILIGVVALIGLPKQNTEQKIIEAKLNDEQLQFLMKEMNKYLTPSENINKETTFKLDEMIKFAFSYTLYLDENNEFTSLHEDKQIGTIDEDKLKENINLIFAVNKVDLEESNFQVVDGKVKVPLNTQGGDAVIYKFKQRNVNTATGIYITDIDCLEFTSLNDKSSILTKTEYDEDAVVYTLQIKYKVVNGRKVLLAYSAYSNLEY